MKLATLSERGEGGKDGTLIVVSRDAKRFVRASEVASTLQVALDAWEKASPKLLALAESLETSPSSGEALDSKKLRAPLPRAYEWVDGSAFINHIVLVRKARGAEPPEDVKTNPLVYQGGSGVLLGPHDTIALRDESWGLDFESEVCVVLGDTPMGTSRKEALKYVRLILICNDITLRNLVPGELAKGFGFFQSKPATAFAPFALTPDELGAAWSEGRVSLKLRTYLNGELVGDPNAGPEMHFSFADLIEHITKTRAYTAGTILGSGTVSNADPKRGVSCLAEKRAREMIEFGEAKTPFLKVGDEVRIEMLDATERNLFGSIQQKVVKA